MDQAATKARERRALVMSTATITALVLLQAPGRIVPETKLDVYLDPWRFLGRAMRAWDPSAAFGRVQNQAVGYLFPMGAFSGVLHSVGVPPWLVQRLWIALVLSLALWGAYRVASAIGVSTLAGRLVAAWAYALAPATLSLAAFQSAGQLPYAVLPHVLAPLLTATEGSSPRRVACRSALWIVVMGGVNGASAFAVLGAVVVWFATRAPGRDRRRLAGWWVAGALAATLWWLVPLVVSIRYGVRFTDFTERSSITTVTESGLEVLRGTGNWLSYLTTSTGQWLPGSWAMAASRIAILGSVAVALLGLVGLARRDAPGRAWLVPTLALGAMAIGVGYAGSAGGAAHGLAQQLLDGPFVAFRNVHKFAALVRLPLALGLGHLVSVARVGVESSTIRRRRAEGQTNERRLGAAPAVTAIAALAIVLAILPASDQLTAPGSFASVPSSWGQATHWLESHQGEGRALVLPGSAFAEYRWGRPLDEPLGPLARTTWAVRDLIPLGGNGSTRLLDGIDRALATDALPPGFVATLQRAGITHLIVRNDLDLARTGGPRPATVRRLLASAPGLRRVASFGPAAADPGADGRLSSPPGQPATESFDDIDIYEVPAAGAPTDARVTTYPATGNLRVGGGPEALLQLDPSDLSGRAVVLDVDQPAHGSPSSIDVATDTARRRDVQFGAIRDNATYTLAPDEPSPTTGKAPQDRWPADAPKGLTTAKLQGAATLTDSQRLDVSLFPEHQPFAAFDGDPRTSWVPPNGGLDDWLDVRFDAPRTIHDVAIDLPPNRGLRIAEVRATTDAGSKVVHPRPGWTTTIALPPGQTRRLRLTVTDMDGRAEGEPPAITDVRLDGRHLERGLVLAQPSSGADLVSIARSRADRFDTGRSDEDGRLDRTFRWTGSRRTRITGTATAAPGAELDALLASAAPAARTGDVTATASSWFRHEPAFAPATVLDGDPATAWISDRDAHVPRLTLRWAGTVPIDNLKVVPLADGASADVDPVGRVVVEAGGKRFERTLDSTGGISIPATVTDHLTLTFPGPRGADRPAQRIGIAEVEVPALLGRSPEGPAAGAAVTLPCGTGPAIAIDGRPIATRARTTVDALERGAAIPWQACGTVALAHGQHRLTSGPGAIVPSTARIAPATGLPGSGRARQATVERWGAEARTIGLGRGPRTILATTENANAGWHATFDGQALTPVRVDGWRQGWIVPAGAGGTVELRYAPGATQRAGLLIGLVALAALVAAAAWPPRRSPTWTPPAERHVPGGAAAILAVAVALALSWPIAIAVLPLAALARRGRAPILTWTIVIATSLAGALALVHPGAGIGSGDGTFSAVAQLLAALALVATTCSLIEPAAGSTPSSPGPVDHPPPGTGTTPAGSG